MKRGKDGRTANGKVIKGESTREIQALSFVMSERVPGSGAFVLKCVTDEDVIRDIKKQGALDTFLTDLDQLYADFKKRFAQ